MAYDILDSRDKEELKSFITENEIGKKTDINSEIFNDYTNNQAGLKAFSITNVVQNGQTATITLDSVEGLAVGDLVSALISPNTFDHFGKITAISGNVITVSITDTGLSLGTKTTGDLWIPAKPYTGTKVYGQYGFSANTNTKASAKAAAAFGEANIAGSKRAFVAGGEDNFAGYCCTVGGQKNTARGVRGTAFGYNNEVTTTSQYGMAVGTNNKVRSNGTFVEGIDNTDGYNSKAGANHIEGAGNTIANGSYGHIHIEGEYNKVESGGQASHIEGKENILHSGNMNHIQGHLNIIFGGSANDVGGRSNLVKGNTNIVSGSDNKINANSAKVTGVSNIVGGWDSESNEPIGNDTTSDIYVDGYGNEIKPGAKKVLCSGFKNTIGVGIVSGGGAEGYTSVSGGYHKLNDGYGMFNRIEGRSHTTNGAITNSHIEGDGHTVTNEVDAEGKSYDLNALRVSGYNNTVINSKYAEVYGQNNTLTLGQCTEVGGIRNNVTGSAIVVTGNDNTVSGSNHFIHSYDSAIEGNRNRVLAEASYIKGNRNVVLGSNLKTEEATNRQIVLGKYNAINNDAVLIVGNGTSDSNRVNGFEVISDGSARIQTASTADDAVVKYSQLKDALDRITELENKLTSMINE